MFVWVAGLFASLANCVYIVYTFHYQYVQKNQKHGIHLMKIQVKIQKWGNSLGLRLSGAMKTIPHFEDNMPVIVDITEKGLYVYPKPKKLKARDLLPFTETELLKDLDKTAGDIALLPTLLSEEYDV